MVLLPGNAHSPADKLQVHMMSVCTYTGRGNIYANSGSFSNVPNIASQSVHPLQAAASAGSHYKGQEKVETSNLIAARHRLFFTFFSTPFSV